MIQEEIFTGNAAGIRITVDLKDIIKDYTRKDGVRIVKFVRQVYANGYSAWKGFKPEVVWKVFVNGKGYSAKTKREALDRASKWAY